MDLSPVRRSDTPLARGGARLEIDNFGMFRGFQYSTKIDGGPLGDTRTLPLATHMASRPIPSTCVKPDSTEHHLRQVTFAYLLLIQLQQNALCYSPALLPRVPFSSIPCNPDCPLSLATCAANDTLLSAHQ